MDRDQVEKSALIESLSRFETIACRICLEREGDDWQVTQIIGDLNNPEPLDSRSDFRSYESVTFVQDVFPAEEVCAWINDRNGKMRNLCFKLPEFHDQIRRERYATGFATNHFYRLPCPFTLYSVSSRRADGRQRDSFRPLVKSGLPSFPNFETAYYRFMLNRSYGPGDGLPQDLLVFRVTHPEAWINSVEVEQDIVTVVLEGDQCQGTQITIGGSQGVVVNELVKCSGAQRFELKDASLDSFWVVLSRDDSWIDWRDNRGGRRTTWNVSGVQPANLSANIEQLRLQGENEQLEYKSRVPDKEDKFLKTVAAFANGVGGILLIGVADDGTVEGISNDVGKCMDAIVNSIGNRIVPSPIFELEKCVVDNKQVVAVFVREGDEPPYGLNNKPPSIYVRRHGTTFDATPARFVHWGRRISRPHRIHGSMNFELA